MKLLQAVHITAGIIAVAGVLKELIIIVKLINALIAINKNPFPITITIYDGDAF